MSQPESHHKSPSEPDPGRVPGRPDEQASGGESLTDQRRNSAQLVFCALFVVVNLVIPILYDDLYPFTSAPMFRDHPKRYSNYYIFGPDHRELPSGEFLLQRVYDGNPPGVGVGISPPPVLEQQFGTVASRSQVAGHVQHYLSQHPELKSVVVRQEVIGANPDGQISPIEVHEWTVQQADSEK